MCNLIAFKLDHFAIIEVEIEWKVGGWGGGDEEKGRNAFTVFFSLRRTDKGLHHSLRYLSVEDSRGRRPASRRRSRHTNTSSSSHLSSPHLPRPLHVPPLPFSGGNHPMSSEPSAAAHSPREEVESRIHCIDFPPRTAFGTRKAAATARTPCGSRSRSPRSPCPTSSLWTAQQGTRHRHLRGNQIRPTSLHSSGSIDHVLHCLRRLRRVLQRRRRHSRATLEMRRCDAAEDLRPLGIARCRSGSGRCGAPSTA